MTSPWADVENLFRPGRDFLVARDGKEMAEHLRTILNEPALARQLAQNGLNTIRARHTCAHRVDELLSIYAETQGIRAKLLSNLRNPELHQEETLSVCP